MASLTGFATEDVYGRKLVDEFVQIDFQGSVSNIFKNALNGIETANFEFPLLTSGDHVVEVLLNATTRRDAKDNIIGVVGIGQDITGKNKCPFCRTPISLNSVHIPTSSILYYRCTC